jgi:hypothetical protein
MLGRNLGRLVRMGGRGRRSDDVNAKFDYLGRIVFRWGWVGGGDRSRDEEEQSIFGAKEL